MKNRESARRHREGRKQREAAVLVRLKALDQRNAYLKAVVAQAAAEVVTIRTMMFDLLAKEGISL